MSAEEKKFTIKQRPLNIIGVVILLACFIELGYYFTTEFKKEKAEIKKLQRMQYIKDSLQVEESILNLKQFHELENENDTVLTTTHF